MAAVQAAMWSKRAASGVSSALRSPGAARVLASREPMVRNLHTSTACSDGRTTGRMKYSYHPRWRPSRAGASQSKPRISKKALAAEEEFGARILYLNRTETLNTLDLQLIRSLRTQLLEWEKNDGVEVVVLKSNVADFFCRGGDVKFLYEKAKDPKTKADALAYFREEFRLSHLVATYTKPIVVQVNGEVLGTDIAMLGRHRISQDSSVFSVPDTQRGSVPVSGASYVLGRLPRGMGMYLGLTGDSLHGEELYWAGLTNVHSSDDMAAEFLQYTLGRAASTNRSNFSVDRDPVYQGNLQVLRESRGVMRYFHMLNEGSATREDMRNYTKLKGWYQYHKRGQFDKAEEWYQENFHAPSDVGELFDFMAPPEIDGYSEPLEPECNYLWDRIDNAVSSIFSLDSATSPPEEIAERFSEIAECFAGDVEQGDVLIRKLPDPDAAKPTRDQYLATLKDKLLPSQFEASVPGGVEKLVIEALIDSDDVPSRLELDTVVEVTTRLLQQSWPLANPSSEDIMQACLEEGLSDRGQLHDAVALAVKRLTSVLTNVPTWVFDEPADGESNDADHFEDLGDLARVDEVRIQEEVDDFHLVHFNITPEDELPPKLPELTEETLADVTLATEATVLSVQDAAQEVQELMDRTDKPGDDEQEVEAEELMEANFGGPSHMSAEYKERVLSDPAAMREALGMPSTPVTKDATEWVVKALAAEKQSQYGVPQVRSVEEIMARLERSNSDFAKQTLDTLRKASPLALKLTHRLITDGSVKTLAECLRMEYQVATSLVDQPDFHEGVAAAMEGRAPAWSHTLDSVPSLDPFFESRQALDLEDRLHLFDADVAANAVWEEELTKWYESGEVLGAGSRELRSRFLWM